METNKWENLLGIDIEEAYTQVHYQTENFREPCAFEEREGEGKIGNQLFYASSSKIWYSGKEAEDHQQEEAGIFFDCGWKQRLLENIPIKIEDRIYEADELFILLVRCHIQKLKLEKIERIAITSAETEFLNIDYEKKLPIQLKDKTIEVLRISHETAYMSFVLHQNECNGVKSVGLLEYRNNNICYQHLGRTAAQDMLKIDRVPLNERIDEAKGETLDERFAGALSHLFFQWRPAIIYLTGEGFKGDWLDQSLKVLCNHGRRAFIGQNLYTKGAYCFALEEGNQRNPKLLAPSLCQFDIGITAFMEGQDRFLSFLEGGCDWYGRKAKQRMILEDKQSLEIIYQNLRTKKLYREIIFLEGLPNRTNMTTRIELEVVYTSSEDGYIKVRDLGFGNLYKATHLVWVKRLKFPEEENIF